MFFALMLEKQNETFSVGFNANIYALVHRASNPQQLVR